MAYGIFCLESLWSNTATDSHRLSVAPIVEFVGNFNNVKHTKFDCGTPAELEFRLGHSRKSGYGILYLAGHGLNGEYFLDHDSVSLEKLAKMMKNRFQGWYIHFGSCLVLNTNEDNIKWFKNITGVWSVSGYKKSIEWVMSSALDLVWLDYMVQGKRKLPKSYLSLIHATEFVIY
jgi:hypothetical protein